MDRKSLTQPEIDEKGAVRSVIATLNVLDHDGDVSVAGSFHADKTVPMLVGHDMNLLSVGKGRVFEENESAIFEGQYNLKSTVGADAYETARFMGSDQEWSYGYEVKASRRGHIKSVDGRSVPARFLEQQLVHEVSMVALGAGIGTRTESVKSLEPEDEGMTFVEQAELIAAGVKALTERATEIMDLRKSRSLGESSLERITLVEANLGELIKSLALISSKTPVPALDELAAEAIRYERFRAQRQGVTI